MGFQDATLLRLLLSLVPAAYRDFIPWPEILIIDLMVCIHRMGAWAMTAEELWNALITPYLELLHMPGNKTRTIWISVDKKFVPKLKQQTSQKRDRTAASASADSEQKSVSLPYPSKTQMDAWGRVIPVRLHPSTLSSNEYAKYVVAEPPSDNKFVVSRMCSSRKFRHRVFLWMFRHMAPKASAHLPSGCRLVISFSEDPEHSPIVVESADDLKRPDFKRWRREDLFNSWSESDHDQPRGLVNLLQREPHVRPLSVLACSVDGDMLGIWPLFLTHPRNSVWVNGGLHVYLWNMNQKEDGTNAKVLHMNTFTQALMSERKIAPDALSRFMALTGNDYTNKQHLLPRLSAEKAWPRFEYLMSTEQKKPLTPGVSAGHLRAFMRQLLKDPTTEKDDKAAVKAFDAITEKQFQEQYERVEASMRMWRLCCSLPGPPEGDEWLQPAPPGGLSVGVD